VVGSARPPRPLHRRRCRAAPGHARRRGRCRAVPAAWAHAHGVRIKLIVDFIHVLEYPWKAADDLNIHRDTLTQTGTRAPGLKRCIDYLTAKQPYLIYRIALTMGWPTATGVIEGACRYLVKDRMAITGARWSLPGAEAVLLLRVVIMNGDFNAYWKFHLQQDRQRTHTSRYQHQYDLTAYPRSRKSLR
jgi:hypothetical protein